MKVKDVQSGVKFDAEIELVSDEDFKLIKSDKRFNKFNWSKYKSKEVYKLKLKQAKDILGLMCMIDHTDPHTNAIEIELLEVSAENIGSNKKLENIGGCLIAFACRESIKRGHEGYVFLIPKTELVNHYVSIYKFEYTPLRIAGRPSGFLYLGEQRSRMLIEKYL